MDKVIQKRLIDIPFYPIIGCEDGDTIFSTDATTLRGYVAHKIVRVSTRGGFEDVAKTVIYIDGRQATDVMENGEVVLPFEGRRPITKINPYMSLSKGYELVELIL